MREVQVSVWQHLHYLVKTMARRASFCHLCDISNPGAITGYINGRPQYGAVITTNVPCRFYSLKSPVQETASGAHIISQLRLRVYLDTSISEDSTVVGKSGSFTGTYSVDSLPEIVYSNKHPAWIECSLKAVES
ncbi:MAG: hypothetical protein BWY45_03453 [Euryarchaeota archaeon ADurb.Bin294]|nr:MAG: hypothetical protein BWY45_03453 [Euryarchaeota archaeon ADurb.Bin294]